MAEPPVTRRPPPVLHAPGSLSRSPSRLGVTRALPAPCLHHEVTPGDPRSASLSLPRPHLPPRQPRSKAPARGSLPGVRPAGRPCRLSPLASGGRPGQASANGRGSPSCRKALGSFRPSSLPVVHLPAARPSYESLRCPGPPPLAGGHLPKCSRETLRPPGTVIVSSRRDAECLLPPVWAAQFPPSDGQDTGWTQGLAPVLFSPAC